MRRMLLALPCICGLLLAWAVVPGLGAVLTRGAGVENQVALTFDACETLTPSFFDRSILDYLLREQLPFTVFVNGKFALRNADTIKALAANPLVQFENHSQRHLQHMERLGREQVVREVVDCADLLIRLTGRAPIFFRFPAGNYDARTLEIVEGLGYRVVHWRFASGDPDPHLTPERLAAYVLHKVGKGDILIFHLNGRGYSTGTALPRIVEGLRRQGLAIVPLPALLATTPPAAAERLPAPSSSPAL